MIFNKSMTSVQFFLEHWQRSSTSRWTDRSYSLHLLKPSSDTVSGFVHLVSQHTTWNWLTEPHFGSRAPWSPSSVICQDYVLYEGCCVLFLKFRNAECLGKTCLLSDGSTFGNFEWPATLFCSFSPETAFGGQDDSVKLLQSHPISISNSTDSGLWTTSAQVPRRFGQQPRLISPVGLTSHLSSCYV